MTGNRIARVLLGLFFIALLATPLVIKQMPARQAAGSTLEAKAAALTRHGFYLEEVAHAAGIDFVHHAPTLDHQLDPIMPEVASLGAAVSIVDFDRDGWLDIYVTNSCEGCKNALYRNLGDGTFKDVANELGIADVNQRGTGVSMGAVWGDYDNDGYEDVLLIKWGRPELFHNLGNGKFEEVSAKLGIDSRRWALAAAAADLRGTGHPDLFIANDYGVSELYFNDGKRFHEVGEKTGVGFAPKSGMNVAFGDILNQGRYAVYVSNISEDGILIQGNNLWIPKEGTSGQNLKYENLARDFGVELGGWSFGAQFGDLNNDGTLDLYLTNGYISLDRNRSYWYDFSKVAGGNSSIIGNAKNWPAFDGRSLAGYQSKRVWLNDGAGRFFDVAPAVGVMDTYDGRALALADLWNRGVLDVVVANQNGPLLVYKNTVTPENEWIEFELEGTMSNRSAIGARVAMFWNGPQQAQEVSGGSGFAAQNQRRLHFGLGRNPRLERAVVRWPSGKLQTIEKPATGQLHKIKEAA